MELRFRRFLSSKRAKQDTQPLEIDLNGASPHAASSPWPLPASGLLPPVSFGREISLLPDADSCTLQAVPYDAVTPSKAPTFTSDPVKGNGPIKLQTNRRSSSGELLVTTQNTQRTLEDILEGDYVVGCKNKQGARNRPSKIASPAPTPALSTTFSYSDSIASPGFTPETPTSPWSISSNAFPENSIHQVSFAPHDGLAILPSPVTPLHPQVDSLKDNAAALDVITENDSTSLSPSPLVQIAEEQNATVAALWKAEYNRLVGLYGRDYMNQKVPHLGATNLRSRVVPITETKSYARVLEVALEPLLHSKVEQNHTHDDVTRRSSNTSAALNSCHDDQSDTSSRTRASFVSSCARSSTYTTQTNVTDRDVAVTRDDIRKIVNDMRSTYLRALETNPPSSPKLGHSVKKKRRMKGGVPATKGAPELLPPLDRQTWHGNDSQEKGGVRKRESKIRATSHPVAGFGRLSPVEASPPSCEKRPATRLQRADSGTLGSLMAKLVIESEAVPTVSQDKAQPEQLVPNQTTPPSLKSGIVFEGVEKEARLLAFHEKLMTQSSSARLPGNFF